MSGQWIRCPAIDTDGYQCVRFATHLGPHQWRRCEWTDPQGYPCILPPSHPGDHELAWFARPTEPGETRTVRYTGRSDLAAAQAEEEARELAGHHWYPASQTYTPGTWGRAAGLMAFLRVPNPRGRLVVIYEYRPGARGSAT